MLCLHCTCCKWLTHCLENVSPKLNSFADSEEICQHWIISKLRAIAYLNVVLLTCGVWFKARLKQSACMESMDFCLFPSNSFVCVRDWCLTLDLVLQYKYNKLNIYVRLFIHFTVVMHQITSCMLRELNKCWFWLWSKGDRLVVNIVFAHY